MTRPRALMAVMMVLSAACAISLFAQDKGELEARLEEINGTLWELSSRKASDGEAGRLYAVARAAWREYRAGLAADGEIKPLDEQVRELVVEINGLREEQGAVAGNDAGLQKLAERCREAMEHFKTARGDDAAAARAALDNAREAWMKARARHPEIGEIEERIARRKDAISELHARKLAAADADAGLVVLKDAWLAAKKASDEYLPRPETLAALAKEKREILEALENR